MYSKKLSLVGLLESFELSESSVSVSSPLQQSLNFSQTIPYALLTASDSKSSVGFDKSTSLGISLKRIPVPTSC
jgi:hypothetical protein